MTLAAKRWQQHTIVGGVGLIFVVLALLPLLWPLIELAGRDNSCIMSESVSYLCFFLKLVS